MELVCTIAVIAATIMGILAYRNHRAGRHQESAHTEAPRQQPPPSYVGIPLDARLNSPEWATPIREAGFDPAAADLVRVVGSVMVNAPPHIASDGMPFVTAKTGILIVQRDRVGIAVPDGGRIVVMSYDNYQAELNVGNTGTLKLVWAGRTRGIVFYGMNADTPEGQEFGNALLRHIHTI